MRILPTQSKNTLIVLLLAALFVVPFCTTFLLDIPIIANSIARSIIIYLLIVAQFTGIILALKYYLLRSTL
jgi:hypothetical protein